MAGLKETRKRIASVKNTQKITKAMKLVSSAKFARALHQFKNVKSYQDELAKICSLTGLLAEPAKRGRELLLVVMSDRGLCGGLNANLLKECERFLKKKEEKGIAVDLILWGKRAGFLVGKTKSIVREKKDKVLEKLKYEEIAKESALLLQAFKNNDYANIFVAASEFKNALSQEPRITTLLPLNIEAKQASHEGIENYLLEPSLPDLFENLSRLKVAHDLYCLMLEASVCEHAARMTAMDSASSNADTVIKSLTLQFNRARQAAITKELIEITSGAEAL